MSAKIHVICRQMSQPAKGFKQALVQLVECCDVVTGCTSPDVRKNSAFQIGTAIQALLCYATPDVYYELFGEFPRRQS